MAGSWTTSARIATWAVPPVIGDGSNAQGGDPPVLAYEPTEVGEGANYVREDWLTGEATQRGDNGEAKFRITCSMGFMAEADPLLFPGEGHHGHHHTFIGNIGLFENLGIEGLASADYTSLRNNPKSSCSGGPLNATLYWEPTLFFEHPSGLHVPMKPNVVSFYYTLQYENVVEMYRLLRGLTFIGGVDPSDRLNTARLAEIPDGQGWDKTRRYNGWGGWVLTHPTLGDIPLDPSNTADYNPQSGAVRQLVNADGSDPWGGAGEDPECVLIASNNSPSAWDGHNLTSPNGRDHFRYPIRKGDNSYNDVGPQGWWKVPHFEVKTEFASSHAASGLTGHAFRSKLYLSSDRHGLIEENWHPRGSTFHFDWMYGWDDEIINKWQHFCTGTTIDGVPGDPMTCGNSTISPTERMLVLEASPDPTMSHDPVITFKDYANEPSREAFWPPEAGTVLPGGTVSNG